MSTINTLTQREVAACFAATEGSFEIVTTADDCRRWVYDPKYPVRKFLGRILGRMRQETKRHWLMWLNDERDDRPNYINELERAWLRDPAAVGPVIIAELPDGSIDIGDGWHRIAIAVAHSMKTVPAVVGMRCTVREG